MFRMGAMAPMYPFMTSNNNQLGITQDHRAYYDILRRLRSIFKIEMDLSELEQMGNRESQELLDNLERLGRTNSEAKQIIDQVRLDYQYTTLCRTRWTLDPALDQALENILRESGSPGRKPDPRVDRFTRLASVAETPRWFFLTGPRLVLALLPPGTPRPQTAGGDPRRPPCRRR